MPDGITGILDGIQIQAEDHHLVPAGDVLPLVAGYRDLLKLAARWEAFGDGEDAQSECASELRAAISRALLGEQHT